jgi:integrase
VTPVEAGHRSGPATPTSRTPSAGATAQALQRRFPARGPADTWVVTRLSRQGVDQRLLAAPFVADTRGGEDNRRHGVRVVLDWLATQPGDTWQVRWGASGAQADGGSDWRRFPLEWRRATASRGCHNDARSLGAGLLSLICADVIRPDLAWLLTTATPRRLAIEMTRTRDPAGLGDLAEHCAANPVGESTTQVALHRIAVILAVKGGVVADIGIGDCLEVLRVAAQVCDTTPGRSPYFYQLLHARGVLGEASAATVRALGGPRQQTVEQLIDRCGIVCSPIRDLLIDYLHERQAGIDHVSLIHLADTLGRLFWRDLEIHHSGIDSLRLTPAVAAGWKQRTATKTVRRTQPDGSVTEVRSARRSALNVLLTVRAFYLDIAQWATDDPARWGPWAQPCPIKPEEMPHRQEAARRKSRMDARTRERLPVLPTLVASVAAERTAAASRLATAVDISPGQVFTAAGQTLRRTITVRSGGANVWAEDPADGRRRNLTVEEHRAFWAWATVEVLRHSGIRIEELTELTHSSLVQYRLPGTGELVPLLHIAPSKTDSERLLVISPEFADALSAIVTRVRDHTGAIPLISAYDTHERVFNPPLAVLFQHRVGTHNRPVSVSAIRKLLDAALNVTGLTDTDGQPLRFLPHDFRRLFITDAVMNGMPPHIIQLLVGHQDINTTMGYKAIYPEEAINGHRAFIARRRELRPSEEYRTPTEQEWEDFLGHFQRRRVALGDCGRAYGTSCIHEHSCLRCSLLRPDPAQRPRMIQIRDNLRDRITEAQQQNWFGEVEGLQVSLAAATAKLTQLDEFTTRQHTTVHLGIPTFTEAAARTVTAPPTPQETR